MPGLLSRWLTSSVRSRKVSSRSARRPLAVERLEARCLLTTFLVTTLSDAPGHTGTSLRDAIAQANAHPNSLNPGGALDAIAFKAGIGTLLKLQGGQLRITDGVSINGPGTIAIDAQQQSRIFDIHICTTSGNVNISKLTLENGRVCARYGGGIYVYDADKVTLTNVRIQGCESIGFGGRGGEGGAIDVEMADLVVVNSVITGNTATADCGCGGGGVGGGINVCGCATLAIQNSTISNNHADGLGGGINLEGKGSIQGSTLSGNSCDGAGGALAFTSPYALNLTNCTIAKNQADTAGAIYAVSFGENAVTIQNSTIAQNTAQHDVGGILNVFGTMNLKNTIVAGNKLGGTVSDLLNGGCGCGDDGGDEGDDPQAVINATYCLIQAPGTALEGSTSSHNLIGLDPRLGPLAFNGGPTQTMALLPGSRAINAGDPNFRPPPSTDQRGAGFARVSGGLLDIGAFEVQQPVQTSHRGQRP